MEPWQQWSLMIWTVVNVMSRMLHSCCSCIISACRTFPGNSWQLCCVRSAGWQVQDYVILPKEGPSLQNRFHPPVSCICRLRCTDDNPIFHFRINLSMAKDFVLSYFGGEVYELSEKWNLEVYTPLNLNPNEVPRWMKVKCLRYVDSALKFLFSFGLAYVTVVITWDRVCSWIIAVFILA